MKKTLGIVLIVYGALILLSALGLLHFSIGYYFNLLWPALLILWGVEMLISHVAHGRHSIFFPIVLVVIGLLLLLHNFGLFGFVLVHPISLIFAVLVLYIGFSIISPRSFRFRHYHHFEMDKKKLKSRRVGETRLGDEPWHLEPLYIDNIAGSVRINLATATLSDGETPIEIIGGFGEVRIQVPAGMAIDAATEVTGGEVRLFDRHVSGLGTNQLAYVDDGYATSASKVKIRIRLRFGEIRVTRAN